MSTIIKVENISKQYRLGLVGTGTLRHDLNRWWHKIIGNEDPYLKIGETNDRTQKGNSDYVWALKDVDFEVQQGELLGIIGRNGAGKSTLLKILSRTTTPTTGEIKMKGRVASLLEVGTGFHPELTGRENIFLNGAILGMTRSEINRKFDEIVDFSGVERYIDTPVKRYSSGMYVRLAFAVAAHLESEILIVDEVLAVGDMEFQKKCLNKMGEVSSGQGRTVLFVSHNMGAIKGLCNKAILMECGKIADIGNVNSVISKYLINPSAVFTDIINNEADPVSIKSIIFKNAAGENTQNFAFGEDLTIEIHYSSKQKNDNPYFWISIYSQFGALFGANMLIDGKRPDYIQGNGFISCTFKKLAIVPQTYSVWIGVRDRNGSENLTEPKEVGLINVIGNIKELDAAEGDLAETLSNDSCPVLVNYEWKMPDGQVVPVNYIK